jgi:hypothetical protein
VYLGGGPLNGEIDLRAEFEQILELRGHYVYLRRAKDRRCGCWNDEFREAKQDCEFCTGTGWAYSDHLVLARRMPIADPGVMSAMGERRSPIGLFNVDPVLFWLKYDKKPNIRDLILEVTLGDDGMPTVPVNVERIWNISRAHDYRDQYGRIEYWACWVKAGKLGKE